MTVETPKAPPRILIVDDQRINLNLFEAYLLPHGYEPLLALGAEEAWALLEGGAEVELIMLDLMMPGVSGFDFLERLKAHEAYRRVPVLMVTASTEERDRVRALELGADDFLTRPVNASELMARVRNLTELGRLQAASSSVSARGGLVLLVGKSGSLKRIATSLQGAGFTPLELSYADDALRALDQRPDLVLIDLYLDGEDTVPPEAALRALQQIKAAPRAVHLPVILLASAHDGSSRAPLYDAGADDVLLDPYDPSELLARVGSLVRRKRKLDELYDSYGILLQRSVMDVLTGVYNRAYLDEVIAHAIALCQRGGQPFSILMLDIDHFKNINDSYGHAVGDEVLKGLAELIRKQVRGSDVIARYGGEEFMVLLHNTGPEEALMIARRICTTAADRSWQAHGVSEQVTVSIGTVSYLNYSDSKEHLMLLADSALYRAKRAGRNQVVAI